MPMFARRSTPLLVAAVVAATLAIPASAVAGNPAISPTDSVAIAVSKGDTTTPPSKSTVTTSTDSPTVSTYSGDTTPLPPSCDTPTTSTSTSTSGTSTPPASGGSGSSTTSTTTPTTCTEVPTPPTTVTPPPTTATPVAGGGVDEPTNDPEPVEVVSGGGDPVEAPTAVKGSGGPELPFTGLPLWYAIYGGIGFMILGGAIWFRTRRA